MHQKSPSKVYQIEASVLSQEDYGRGYHNLILYAREISQVARPGQFIHVKIPSSECLLRRPFSICDVDPTQGTLRIFYKQVGKGTSILSKIPIGTRLDVMGPLGNGFPPVHQAHQLILVAGGYGAAALYFVARTSPIRGTILLGARTHMDLFFYEEYENLGFNVMVTTDDGSRGTKGKVTDLLPQLIKQDQDLSHLTIFGCGPSPMLKTLAAIGKQLGISELYLSLDERMCCGVGACYTCVIKIHDPSSPTGWHRVRTCREGPVFKAQSIIWDDTGT